MPYSVNVTHEFTGNFRYIVERFLDSFLPGNYYILIIRELSVIL